METIEVHNIYTLYEIEVDSTEVETPILGFSRPQDWGDSSRWHYHQCRGQFSYSGTVYINNCHLWQKATRNSAIGIPVYCPVSIYGVNAWKNRATIAGKEFLDGDDFWDARWGDLPPYYEEDEEDDY